MKKIALLCVLSGVFFTTNLSASADVFDSLDGLSSAQKSQITNIQNSFNVKNAEIEKKISKYVDIITKLRTDTQKTQTQIALLRDVYEKNIMSLRNQQELLLQENDSLFKTILTDKQYNQYMSRLLNVQR